MYIRNAQGGGCTLGGNEMEFISVREAAAKWGISERCVHKYCEAGRIPGLKRFGRSWAIPAGAEKPMDIRKLRRLETQKAEASKCEEAFEKRKEREQEREQKAREERSRELRVGAVITAAGRYNEDEGISPFLNLGHTSLIRRIVLILQQAQISPIVVVTGYDALEMEHHLSDYNVIFIHNENYDQSDKFDSAKLGLRFLMDKCDKVFFASVKIPMFMPYTLQEMICANEKIMIPRYEERNGHPLLLDAEVIPAILQYQGDEGMRGAMDASGYTKKYLQVADEGVLLSAENISHLEEAMPEHNEKLLHPFIRLSIEKNRVFFNSRARMLLFLIREVHSIQGACRQMALSRGKAWDMITRLEEELGFTVVKRQQGGGRERKTSLTPQGEAFLEFYRGFEEAVKEYAGREFQKRYEAFRKEMEK